MAQKDPLPIYFEKQAFAVQKGEGRSVPGNKLAADSCAFSFTSGEAAMLRLCFLSVSHSDSTLKEEHHGGKEQGE